MPMLYIPDRYRPHVVRLNSTLSLNDLLQIQAWCLKTFHKSRRYTWRIESLYDRVSFSNDQDRMLFILRWGDVVEGSETWTASAVPLE